MEHGFNNNHNNNNNMISVKNDVTATWFPWKMMLLQHDSRETSCHSNIISVKNDVAVSFFLWKKKCRSIVISLKFSLAASWFLWQTVSQCQHNQTSDLRHWYTCYLVVCHIDKHVIYWFATLINMLFSDYSVKYNLF